jgi:hypothetical protein
MIIELMIKKIFLKLGQKVTKTPLNNCYSCSITKETQDLA